MIYMALILILFFEFWEGQFCGAMFLYNRIWEGLFNFSDESFFIIAMIVQSLDIPKFRRIVFWGLGTFKVLVLSPRQYLLQPFSLKIVRYMAFVFQKGVCHLQDDFLLEIIGGYTS